MFKNKDKEFIFYNYSNNTFKQVFREELLDNLDEIKEGFFDEFVSNDIQLKQILVNKAFGICKLFIYNIKSVSISNFILAVIFITLIDLFLTRKNL